MTRDDHSIFLERVEKARLIIFFCPRCKTYFELSYQFNNLQTMQELLSKSTIGVWMGIYIIENKGQSTL